MKNRNEANVDDAIEMHRMGVILINYCPANWLIYYEFLLLSFAYSLLTLVSKFSVQISSFRVKIFVNALVRIKPNILIENKMNRSLDRRNI